ncbi:MAG TPA: hypothetical protein VL026_06160 [Rhizomicrobium sp.]|nr:hypothetical protein [Rhizomicrobium sp.]
MKQLNTVLCLFTGLALSSGALAQSSIRTSTPISPRQALSPGTSAGSTHLCGIRPRIADLPAWSAYEACRTPTLNHSRKIARPATTGFFGVPQRRSRFAVH